MQEEWDRDAAATCYRCGHRWTLVELIARALFKCIGPGAYECGPSHCPRCNPRAGARGGADAARAVPINVPADAPRPKEDAPPPEADADQIGLE